MISSLVLNRGHGCAASTGLFTRRSAMLSMCLGGGHLLQVSYIPMYYVL